jgi:hypothetical protein
MESVNQITNKDYEKLKQIEVAITSFNNKNLYDSSLALFNTRSL